MPPEPLPHVDPGAFEHAKRCLCGADGAEEFRGWWLCADCLPGVQREWRRRNPKMATSLKTRRR